MAAVADDIHIIDFYKDTARALVSLYNAFPRKVELYVEDISGPDQEDEFGLHSKRHLACLGALLWLQEEGYIRYASQIRETGIDQVILSARTFTQLTALAGNQPVIHAVKAALKSGSSQQLVSVMSAFYRP